MHLETVNSQRKSSIFKAQRIIIKYVEWVLRKIVGQSDISYCRKTNIGRELLKQISKYLQANHKSERIFNRRMLKVSYSCCKRFISLINQHNAKTIRSKHSGGNNEKNYNCKVWSWYPLGGNCLDRRMVYRAKVKIASSQYMTCKGASENSFKTTLYSHRKQFQYSENRRTTSFAKHVLQLKRNGTCPFKINWAILEKIPYKHVVYRGPIRCNLSLTENIFILFQDK